MLSAGYFLGGLVERFVRNVFGIEGFLLEDHIDKVVIVVVFLSVLPIVFEFIRSRREIGEAVEVVVDEIAGDEGEGAGKV